MMVADHQRMMAEMKAADDRLQQLVSKMNSAAGDQKISAMAELLTALVTEQTTMHRRMAEMQGMMPMHRGMMPPPAK
jgi:hypothetical protein